MSKFMKFDHRKRLLYVFDHSTAQSVTAKPNPKPAEFNSFVDFNTN